MQGRKGLNCSAVSCCPVCTSVGCLARACDGLNAKVVPFWLHAPQTLLEILGLALFAVQRARVACSICSKCCDPTVWKLQIPHRPDRAGTVGSLAPAFRGSQASLTASWGILSAGSAVLSAFCISSGMLRGLTFMSRPSEVWMVAPCASQAVHCQPQATCGQISKPFT